MYHTIKRHQPPNNASLVGEIFQTKNQRASIVVRSYLEERWRCANRFVKQKMPRFGALGCREEGSTRFARDPGGGVNPMPAPSSHCSFFCFTRLYAARTDSLNKKCPVRGIGLQRGRDSNLTAKALILLGFEDSNYPSPPNNELW